MRRFENNMYDSYNYIRGVFRNKKNLTPEKSISEINKIDIPGVKFTSFGSQEISINSEGNFEYSFDGVTWETLSEPVDFSGRSVYIKGNNPDGLGDSDENYSQFIFSNPDSAVDCSGNVMDLLGVSVIPSNYCFYKLFSECPISSTPELPAESLTVACYQEMFSGCPYLTKVSKLPALEMKNNCYYGMFKNCPKLVKVPTDMLPGVSLTTSCYAEMFSGCASLKKAPKLEATELGITCYFQMFSGCENLTEVPEVLPALLLTEFCYCGMFQDCVNLKKAPELPALGLIENCYNNMFSGCSNLEYIKAAFLSTPGEGNTMNWVSGVSESGIFVKNPEATWDVTGDSGIPENWEVL